MGCSVNLVSAAIQNLGTLRRCWLWIGGAVALSTHCISFQATVFTADIKGAFSTCCAVGFQGSVFTQDHMIWLMIYISVDRWDQIRGCVIASVECKGYSCSAILKHYSKISMSTDEYSDALLLLCYLLQGTVLRIEYSVLSINTVWQVHCNSAWCEELFGDTDLLQPLLWIQWLGRGRRRRRGTQDTQTHRHRHKTQRQTYAVISRAFDQFAVYFFLSVFFQCSHSSLGLSMQ